MRSMGWSSTRRILVGGIGKFSAAPDGGALSTRQLRFNAPAAMGAWTGLDDPVIHGRPLAHAAQAGAAVPVCRRRRRSGVADRDSDVSVGCEQLDFGRGR